VKWLTKYELDVGAIRESLMAGVIRGVRYGLARTAPRRSGPIARRADRSLGFFFTSSLLRAPEHLRRFYAAAAILRLIGDGGRIMFHMLFIVGTFCIAVGFATEVLDRLLP